MGWIKKWQKEIFILFYDTVLYPGADSNEYEIPFVTEDRFKMA